jgi:putative inorganic carbon (hco3(-)) transporter
VFLRSSFSAASQVASYVGSRIAEPVTSHWRGALWSTLAVLCGAAVGFLPLPAAIAILVAGTLLVGALIDTRVAVITTLVIAPLKVLTETQLPITKTLPLDIGQITLLLTAAIWIAKSIASKRTLNLPRTPIVIPVIIFILGASLSLWGTVQLWDSFKELLIWVEMLLMILMIGSLMRTTGAWWITAGLVMAGCAQAIVGIYEFRGGSGAAHLWILDYRYFRAFGSFGQPNPFGAFMGLMLCVSLGAFYGSVSQLWNTFRIQQNNRRTRLLHRNLAVSSTSTVLYGMSSLILAAGLVVSWSRGAWMGFGAAMIVFIFFMPRRRLVGAAMVSVLVLALVVGVVTGLAPTSLVSRLSDFGQDLTGIDDVRGQVISDENYAVLERLAHWQAAIGMATDHPLTGVGFGTYQIAYPKYALMNWPLALGHAHNYYLNLLAEIGVIGLSAYLMAWIVIIRLTLRVLNQRTGFERGVALGILAAWTQLAVHSVFDKLYVNNIFLHIGAMLGLIGGLLIYERVRGKTLTDGIGNGSIRRVF